MRNPQYGSMTLVKCRDYTDIVKGDYEKLCEEAITSLGAPPIDFHPYQDEDYVPTPSGMDIGEYRNAVYHREGLFSVIYKAITAKFEGYFASFGTTGKVVALKVTTPSHMEPPHDSKREARILALAASDRVIPPSWKRFMNPVQDSPPELLFGNKKYGCELDLWAAGCTVAEALVPDHPTLFDSGELGSDLALISSVFSSLGTPDLSVWPEAAEFPDWGKVQFIEFPTQPWSSLLPGTLDIEQDLVSQLVRYESGSRLKAAQVRLYTTSVMEWKLT
ncbi:mitogen-activated protein kinase [Didymosphaeria variabile]|uniref:cyclin-dependent kinase n=1 Tax=Didymosphaeria variabile TaxID=1932322 RepID=A0A9W8XCV9_9PLEO|nr:mitogen-activated protein kinase [Didymosphaeria variabile]KAJ4347163.1 mitogen-activated protein kinase [Didymosphaeria variabile]